jgi:hypothetical protein
MGRDDDEAEQCFARFRCGVNVLNWGIESLTGLHRLNLSLRWEVINGQIPYLRRVIRIQIFNNVQEHQGDGNGIWFAQMWLEISTSAK